MLKPKSNVMSMSAAMTRIADLHARWSADPECRRAYEELGATFALAAEEAHGIHVLEFAVTGDPREAPSHPELGGNGRDRD